MIQWLSLNLLVSLLDESAFVNKSLESMTRDILTAPFRHLYSRNNVIDKSLFEVSNYFQKVISLLYFDR